MVDTASTVLTAASRKHKSAEAFVKGSIVRINLKNFLTYDQCSFRLNPKLNVIIGPNGTGKSSVVCAICIGLGGKPSFLARAKELGDFIKHGKDKASIEVELCNTPKNDIIRRDIGHIAGGKTSSAWFLNGAAVSVKQIDEVVNKHNVMLSNLCQFLPQERVADFAKMNKIELLENTELAVCPVSMQEDHKWLKQYRTLQKELELKHKDDVEYLDKLVQKNERVEREVKRFQERHKIMERLKILDQKRGWLVYEEARQEYNKRKEEHKALKQKKSIAQRELLPLIKIIEKIKNAMLTLDKDNKKKGDELKSMASETKNIHTEIGEMDEKVQEKWDEYKEREKDEQLRLKKVEQCQLQISGWEGELEQLQESDVQSEIDNIKSETKSTVTAIANAEHEQLFIQERKQRKQREIKGCEAKLAELNNLNERRLEFLRRKNKDCYNAIVWLRSNRSMFKATIHEPILLTIDMKDPRHAELLENHISFRDLFAFVCEDGDDNDRFIREVHEKQALRVNVIKAPRSREGKLMTSDAYRPRRNIKDLKQWGFTSFLRELFKAPDAVMAYLCKQYRVHEIPVGSARTKDIVDQVTQKSNIDLFFIPTLSPNQVGSRYSVKKSKYSSNTIVGSRALRRAEFLDSKVDPDELKQIQQAMQNLKSEASRDTVRYSDLAEQKKKLEKKDNELRTKMKELLQHKNKRKNLENKIMLKKQNLEELENSPVDLESIRTGIERAVNQIILKKKELTLKFITKIRCCVDVSIGKGTLQLRYTQCLRRRAKAEQQVRELNLKNTELIKACERVEEAKKEAEQKAKQLLNEAKRKTGDSIDHLKKIFADYPDDLTEVDTLRHELGAKLDCCGTTDPKIVEEYTNRKKEIEQFQKKVDKAGSLLESQRDDMEEVKTRWLTPLQKLISKINVRFAKYFEQMGCAGEVDLHTDNPDDFDKYGIRIRVKFRASSTLQELDPFRQSGGERSVSTMLYLVALQSLHTCPFRVVDEINQGMDPDNERRVFQVIVNSSSKEFASQYVLITPKLLPNLTYNRHMTVHCVYNGPHMPQHNEWKLSRFIRKRRMLKYEDEDD
uniref:Structural maintenance of chromosomes protein 5 n=1 Tax=Phallusia mammillata TaxID=59560 RepID=A0A6F9DTN6_9ASCI|nr:structural maintenance of chromosomes protein 5-like [Phallusia mammillata]